MFLKLVKCIYSDIELQADSDKSDQFDIINENYLTEINELYQKCKRVIVKDNNKFIMTDSHVSGLNLPNKLLQNKLEMIKDFLNILLQHQNIHMDTDKKYEPLAFTSTNEFGHPLYTCSSDSSYYTIDPPHIRQIKTMYLEQNVQDYGAPYWTLNEILRAIIGLLSEIKYIPNTFKPINIPFNIEVKYLSKTKTIGGNKYNKYIQYDELKIILVGIKLIFEVMQTLSFASDDILIIPYNYDTTTKWGEYKKNAIINHCNQLYPLFKQLTSPQLHALLTKLSNYAQYKKVSTPEINSYRPKHVIIDINKLTNLTLKSEFKKFQNNIVKHPKYLRRYENANFRKIYFGGKDLKQVFVENGVDIHKVEKMKYPKIICNGMSFGFTGTLEVVRWEIKDLLKQLGAVVTVYDSVKNITHLIMGTHCVSKDI